MSGTSFVRRRWGWFIAAPMLAPVAVMWLPDGAFAATSDAAAIDWTALAATAAVAILSAGLATLLGAAMAAALTFTNLRGRAWWGTALLLPFVCPPLVWSLGQLHVFGAGGVIELALGTWWAGPRDALGRGGYLPTILVLAQIHAPLCLLILLRGFAGLRQAGFESARLFLSRRGLVRWGLVAVRGELTAAFLLATLLGMGNFAVPHVMQCRLVTQEIYLRMNAYLDPLGAVRGAAPLLVVALLVAVALFRFDRPRGETLPMANRGSNTILRGRRAGLVATMLGIYLVVVCVVPIATLVVECRGLGEFTQVVRDAATETANTLQIAAGASLLAVGLGAATAWGCDPRSPGWLNLLALVPLAVPPIVLGLAWSRFANRSWPVDLSVLGATSALVVLGQASRGWPFAARLLEAARRRTSPTWHDAARLSGLGAMARWRWISWPLVAGNAAAAALLVFVLTVGEVEISQLLCAPGSGTLGLRLFTFLHFGPAHVAAGLAVLQLGMSTLPVLIYFLLTDRLLEVV